tara:strand:+ start:714 stop:905 length:192 start_codon:yes stop_codon:yes gene_type:complete
MEFNTTEDVHTVMKYRQQEARGIGANPMLVTVDLDSPNMVALEETSKLQSNFWLNVACSNNKG